MVPVNRPWTMGQPDAPVVQGRIVRPDLVTQYVARIPVSGDLYGDISRSILAVANTLTAKGYGAAGRGIQTGTRYGGAPVYGKAEFTLRRKGAAFSAGDATRDLQAAASSVGLKLALLKDWVTQVVKFVAEAPGTSAQAVADKAAAYQRALAECKAKGGWFCVLQAVGIPAWATPLAIAGVGVVALGILAVVAYPYVATRRALGEAPEARRRRKPKRVRDTAGETSTTANDPRQARRIAEGLDPLPDRYVRGWAKQKRGGSNQRSLIGAAGRACTGTGPIGGPRRSACLRNYIRKHR